MTTRISTRRELELMQQLQQLADARAARERAISAALDAELEAARVEFEEAADKLNESHAAHRRQIENDFAAANQLATAEYERERRAADGVLEAVRRSAQRRRDDAASAATQHCQDGEWQALAVFDAAKIQPPRQLEETRKRLRSSHAKVEGLERDARTLLDMRRLLKHAEALPPPSAMTSPPASAPEEELNATLSRLHKAVLELQDQRLASLLLERGKGVWWIIGFAAVGAFAGGALGGFAPLGWFIGAVAGLGLAAGGVTLLKPGARRNSLKQYQIIRELAGDARQLERLTIDEATAAMQWQLDEIVSRRDADVRASQRIREKKLAEADAELAEEFDRSESQHTEQAQKITAARDAALVSATEKYPPLLLENAADRQRDDEENVGRHETRIAAAHAQHAAGWKEMADAWLSGFREIADELSAMQARCDGLFPDWSSTDLETWPRPAAPPEAIALGRCTLPLAAVKNGMPQDPRLDPGVRRLDLPVAMTLDEQPRLIITADGGGRRSAAQALQLATLRFLTAMPAGKVRLTVIDAAGLGDNFSAFMHLADQDEQLLSGRIWTATKQIDERLALVAEHMEKVLQKYLRNEFATIANYNLTAGEVSEPYQLVVAANFPAGFSEAAARKLVSIAANGPRCGVYVLASIDRELRLPHEFKTEELISGSMHLDWDGSKLVWRYPLFEKLPLEIDPLPLADKLTEVLRIAGRQSKAASRVEVPFELAAPTPEKFWSFDSSRELAAPIGRAGAKEMQELSLGLGTAQHVLISGKTGSGKSTLLHALITNLALHYGPDQLEFYLVDFKKGVEFKAYATGQLPHARVIAIESEREFGVSVLERLDQELRRRGELFRRQGVQDLAGFRRAAPDIVMPRTLLVVDEFQELFVADDKLAGDSALLLDRLVRQGRAFGIHVLLGSQTLAGAYSLARSTLGQMAVRIALECSEADSHIILSDENMAAKLLSRPGEAIYNDQNGLVAGNHPFQVVWLPDAQRQQYLAAMRNLPPKPLPTTEPAIVFEGNVPADPRDNSELIQAISHPERTTPREPTIWLGSAVRIEPATKLMLRRQGGHNLSIVGQDETQAAGILSTSVLALATQHGPGSARFKILDGGRPESRVAGLWTQVVESIGDAAELVTPRTVSHAVNAVADEVARRSQAPQEVSGSIYIVVHDLAQFRDLRQTEDDFGFSFSNGKTPSVDKRFRDILREGPALGVHVLLWCESLNTLTRCVDRTAMREIEFRIAMQMSAADSTSFIDSPGAALLGDHRALLYRDDLGTTTKFRPYGQPSDEWLAWAAGQLRRNELARDGLATRS